MKRFAVAAACLLFPLLSALAASQTPAVKPAPKATTNPAAARPQPKPTGSLAQIMRGIYFPNANLIFDVQQRDPGASTKKTETEGTATATYGNAYTGWEVVENAAVALSDGVDLILMPGRSCQNGKPVPVGQADFRKFARSMRAAGQKVLEAARTKNQEKVSDATNDLADACSSCHEIYRDKGPADSPLRCTPPPK